MPRPLDQVARHGWVVVQPVKGSAHRYEYGGGGSDRDPFSDFAAGDVMVHGVFRGTEAEIAAKDACLREAAQAFHQEYPHYFAIPGPNSNTFVAYVDRRCKLGIELPATAIGRDYVGPIGADLTEARTGIQLGSFPFGLRLGLREGVEVHFFGLPLGVHFWPPGINVPVNPGRIGFASDEHVRRPPDAEGEREIPDHAAKKGAASARMFASAWGTLDRDRALGLVGQGLVGLSGRAVLLGRVGYAVGLDLEAGVAVPAGFAYGARLFPVGVGVLLSQTGYLALFSGIGASGVTARVPSGLELPQELRLEIDVGPRARLAMYGRGTFVALQPVRRCTGGGRSSRCSRCGGRGRWVSARPASGSRRASGGQWGSVGDRWGPASSSDWSAGSWSRQRWWGWPWGRRSTAGTTRRRDAAHPGHRVREG
jgi:hypothetical protein